MYEKTFWFMIVGRGRVGLSNRRWRFNGRDDIVSIPKEYVSDRLGLSRSNPAAECFFEIL